MSNFDPNAIIRGAQLTFVGANRALQNPDLFTTNHYRQAAIAVCAGLAIRLVLNIPIYIVKAAIWLTSLGIDLDHKSWDETLVGGLDFISTQVLQIPFFLMMVMSNITPTLDNLFMDSLRWVDQTYVQKHKSEDPKHLRAMYYPTLEMYSTHGAVEKRAKRNFMDGVIIFATKYGKRAAISLAIYLLTFVPEFGPFVLPAASFYTFNKAVGPVPAGIIFATWAGNTKALHGLLFADVLCISKVNVTVIAAILRPYQVHKTAEKGLVHRAQRCVVRLLCSLRGDGQNPIAGCVDLRSCGSLNSVSDYKKSLSHLHHQVRTRHSSTVK